MQRSFRLQVRDDCVVIIANLDFPRLLAKIGSTGPGAVSRQLRPVHADQLVFYFGGCNRLVDSARLSGEVRIDCAKDDSRVVFGPVLMKAEKMSAIVRQQNPTFGDCERQHLRVRHSSIRFSCV